MKILKISVNNVVLGTESGEIETAQRADFDFKIYVGMEVEKYQGDGNIIYIPKHNSLQNGNRVNKVAYVLLAFFLGGIGIHKFYAHKIAAGILFILFCWTLVPSLLAFIDFIVALCTNADDNGCIYIL